MLFRFIGSTTKTASQALAPTIIMVLAAVLFTGFAIPPKAMLGWCRWITYLSPMAWAMESLMINELNGRTFPCTNMVPNGAEYDGLALQSRACDIVGAMPGVDFVTGTQHLMEAYNYKPDHRWRNLGVMVCFLVFFLACNLVSSELVASAKSKGEVLVFPRGKLGSASQGRMSTDVESGPRSRTSMQESAKPTRDGEKQTSVFHWRNVVYEVQIKATTRRILDNVDGWVKPGSLTALMVGFSVSCRSPTDHHRLGCLWCGKNNTSGCPCVPHHRGGRLG